MASSPGLFKKESRRQGVTPALALHLHYGLLGEWRHPAYLKKTSQEEDLQAVARLGPLSKEEER